MAQWQNKEEYEKWKAGQLKKGKEELETQRNKEAILQPSAVAGKSLGISTVTKVGIAFIITVVLFVWIGSSINKGGNSGSESINKSYTIGKNLPQFKITGYVTSGLVLLVPPDTSNDQLRTLINEFRSARANNALPMLIPPTTKGGAAGDYGVVWIFVFSEEQWATRNNVLAYTTSKTVDQEIVNHIRAEYYYGAGTEYGNLGCRDEKDKSPFYEYIF